LKKNEALQRGYAGLRLTGNTFWLERNNWISFTEYEAEVNNVIGSHKMIALCSYSLDKCNVSEVLDVVDNHQFALTRRKGRWEILQSLERKRIVDILERTEKKFSTLYSSMTEGVALHDVIYDSHLKAIDYIITDVNSSFERNTGINRDEALGRKASELYGIGKPPYLDVYAKVASGGEPEIFETYFAPMKKHFEISVFSPEKGKFATVFNDITKYKRAEEELRKSEEQFRSLANLTPIHISVSRASDGKILFVNATYEENFGYGKGELVGVKASDLYCDQKDRVKLLNILRKQGFVRDYEVKVKRKDGSAFWVSASIAPFSFGDEQALLGASIDITERKRLEGLKDQFISAVTHELRTPLVSMKGYVDFLLMDKATLPQDVASSLEVVKEQGERLLRITDDLLDYRRLLTNRFRLELSRIDMKKVISESFKETESLFKNKKQILQIELPEDPMWIEADKTRLIQVVSNLLTNASKFNSEGGQVRVCVEEIAGAFKVSVSDTGIGIKAEDLYQVFEPFAAIEKPQYVKGTGLGLSISKGIVESHGGKIWAESEGLGHGSTFNFTIPKKNS
jgi:PAS domain S-box-containing protein